MKPYFDIFGNKFKINNKVICHYYSSKTSYIMYGTLLSIDEYLNFYPKCRFLEESTGIRKEFYLYRMCNIESKDDPIISLFLLRNTDNDN